MRLCIYGAGAVGGHLAAKLAAAGHEVGVIARGRNLAVLRESGIKLRHGEREIAGRVRAEEDPAQLGLLKVATATQKSTPSVGFSRTCPLGMNPAPAVVLAQNVIPCWYVSGFVAGRP